MRLCGNKQGQTCVWTSGAGRRVHASGVAALMRDKTRPSHLQPKGAKFTRRIAIMLYASTMISGEPASCHGACLPGSWNLGEFRRNEAEQRPPPGGAYSGNKDWNDCRNRTEPNCSVLVRYRFSLAVGALNGFEPMSPLHETKQPERPKLREIMGPGVITCASDDDPSGIATYSQAGAQFGYSLGWTPLLTSPQMCAIQLISAEVGRVTRPRAGRQYAQTLASLLALSAGWTSGRREHHQSRRHGGGPVFIYAEAIAKSFGLACHRCDGARRCRHVRDVGKLISRRGVARGPRRAKEFHLETKNNDAEPNSELTLGRASITLGLLAVLLYAKKQMPTSVIARAPVQFKPPVARTRDNNRTAVAPSWMDIAKQTWASFNQDRILAVAAGITFYGLLAIFPALDYLFALLWETDQQLITDVEYMRSSIAVVAHSVVVVASVAEFVSLESSEPTGV